MVCRLNRNTGVGLLVMVLAIILVSGGLLAACSRTQTTTTTTVTTSATSTATTVSAASFYKDSVVTITVPYGPGGGVDYAARLFANYWTQVTGGRMLVVNKEGGGGLVGTNYVYAAKPDGLNIGVGIMDATLLSPVLAQDPAVRYDLKKMSWIEYTNPGEASGLAVGVKSPYASMQDLSKASGLKFASVGRYDSPALAAGLVIDLFALKDARIVAGYSSTAEVALAVSKGESDGYVVGSANIADGMTKGLNKTSLLTLDFARTDYFPDTPAISELLKLSPGQENLVKTKAALSAGGGQIFWFQPGVPPDRIDFVRNAFAKIVTIEDFLKQSAARWKYVKPVSGMNFAAEMEKTLAVTTPENFKGLQALVDKYIR